MTLRILPLFALITGLGCSTGSLEPDGLNGLPIVLLSISNPPPPPIETDPFNPLCEDTDCPTFGPAAGLYFRNPAGTLAFLTFSASPTVLVSPDAQVRDQGTGAIGRGTIVTDVLVGGDPPPSRVIIELNTVQGSLFPRPGTREVSFTASATFVSNGLPVPGGVLFLFRY
jgi:hypothetical protein